ncbi:MAG: cyclic nucleotide-binding domain-containing protein [Beijerinckiaceae bacterium]|nr:cyclic nucleotide-binding domain-containing protein [Beijerinckiaceae bacterium]
MEKLFPYIVKETKLDQLKILLIVLLSFPFYFVSLDLPKQIISNAIQGKQFPTVHSTVKVLKISLSFPSFISDRRIDIFDGIDMEQFAYLFYLSGLFLALVLINGFFKYKINIKKGALGERFIQNLRLTLFTRLLTFTPEALRNLKPSEAATILKDEVEPIGGFVGDAFVQPLFLGGQALTALLFIILQSPQLGLIAVLILFVQLAVIPKLRREQLRLGAERQKKQRAFAGKVGEVVECLPEIGNQGGAALERRRVAERLDDLYNVRFRLYERKFAVKFLNNLLAQLTPFLFYTIGGFYALKGDIDIGQLVAVIGAYRDLPPPLKELIDWDQQRLDVETKFQLVSQQFPMMMSQEPTASIKEREIDDGLDHPSIVSEQISIQSAAGDPLLSRCSFEIPFGSHVAILDLGGDGARNLGQALGGRLSLSGGNLLIGGVPFDQIKPERLGKLIGYANNEPTIFDGTIYDNIIYSLHRSRAGLEPGSASIDYHAAGCDTEAAFQERLLAVLGIVGLDGPVFAFGLARRLDPAANARFADSIVVMRKKLRARIAHDDALTIIEPFDPSRYTANASIIDNIIFGVPHDPSTTEQDFARQETMRRLLDEHGLSEALVQIGERIAAMMIEIFKDIDQDNILFEQFAFIPSSKLSAYGDILNRRLAGTIVPEDQTLLIALAFLYIEPRHRLGLLNDELRAKLLTLRAAYASRADNQILIDRYDPDSYCASASLRDNLLFGLVAYGAPGGADQATAAIYQVIADEGLLAQVYRVGLDQPTGYGGRLLYPATRMAVALARNIIKKPAIFILNDAFGAFGESDASAILRRVRMDMIGRTLLVIGRKIDAQWPFDMRLSFDGARMAQVERKASDERDETRDDRSAALDANENVELRALRAVPIFNGLDLANLKLLAFTSEKVVFKQGDTLFSQGQESDVAYTIISGQADVLIETADGPVVISSVGENQIIGEMGIITGEPRSATIVAKSEITALSIRKDVFTALLAEFPVMAMSVTRLVVKRLQDNVKTIRKHEAEQKQA